MIEDGYQKVRMLSASVVIPCRNAAATIHGCVTSVLNNDYPLFEVIVVDDCSNDQSLDVLRTIVDDRLRTVRTSFASGSGLARNLGVTHSQADVVFFTDADCTVSPTWISQGLLAFQDTQVVGVEGPIFSDSVAESIIDKLPVNPFYHKLPASIVNQPGRDFACGNIAYRRLAFQKLEGFKGERFSLGREDTDLAWRARQFGSIAHANKMIVRHASEVWTWSALKANSLRYRDDVTFYKMHRYFFFMWMRILHPRFFFMALIPILIPFYYPIRNCEEARFAARFYQYLLRLRLTIWRAAYHQRVFII